MAILYPILYPEKAEKEQIMALTDLTIKKSTSKRVRYEIPDGKGLALRVMPSGSKSWVFRYMVDGVARRMTLGSYPAISLAEAREKHGAAMMALQRGVDPGAEQQAEKAKHKTAPTFQDMLTELWEIELKHKKSGGQSRYLLTKNVVPAWGKRKVADIKRRDIVLLLDQIRDRAPVVANRVHGALSRLFNFAAERGVIEDSPCTRIRKPPEKGRSRVLSDEEIKALWLALDLENTDADIYRVSKLALKMILLTGQRSGEVCGATWAEIDEETAFWNIPAERMKNAQSNRVPLCPMALEIIQQAKVYSDPETCLFVFQSSYKPGEAMTRHALSRAVARHWSEIEISEGKKAFQEGFTPHDLRRTLRTRLAELGVSDVVAERVLGHKLQGIMGVYNRHAYDEEKRQALMKWEGRLKEILGQSRPVDNVIQLRRRS